MTALSAKISGKVKFFDAVKGFGFIVPDNGEPDLFVHQTSIHSPGFRSLKEGEPVEFDVSEDEVRGKRYAINVTGPNGEYVQGQPRPQRMFNDQYSNGQQYSQRPPRNFRDEGNFRGNDNFREERHHDDFGNDQNDFN
jgi:cold shock CspA family protein